VGLGSVHLAWMPPLLRHSITIEVAEGIPMRLLIAFATTVSMSAAAAAEPAELYQLQLQCVKNAAEVFAKDYGNGTDDGYSFNYQAHYNAHQNRCFFLLISTFNENDNVIQSYYLSDLFENREYGTFSQSTKIGVFECNVLNTVCSSSSKSEWDKLVKPYMDE
jgi:hypothetical protein